MRIKFIEDELLNLLLNKYKMNSYEVDSLLIELIMNVIKKERELEIQRQIFNEKEEFEPFAVFTRIERGNNEKRIKASHIQKFLEDNSHISTEKNKGLIQIFIDFYDVEEQESLSYEKYRYL